MHNLSLSCIVSQAGKKVLGCGSNVVDHIYNVKGKQESTIIYPVLIYAIDSIDARFATRMHV